MMGPDVASNWIALVALVFSAIALAVSVYNAMLNRPRLRINASNRILILDGFGHQDGPFVKITVTNIGTQPTTVTSIGLMAFNHAWTPKFGLSGANAVLTGGGHSSDIPKALGPGEYMYYFANETNDLHESFLSKPACYVAVSHSWAEIPKTKRIKLIKKET